MYPWNGEMGALSPIHETWKMVIKEKLKESPDHFDRIELVGDGEGGSVAPISETSNQVPNRSCVES